jgi:hypothetical protein
MKKMPCLFKRNFGPGQNPVYNEVTKGCEWVVNGEGYATRKYDGTCCLYKKGQLFKRYTLKPGKIAPDNFIPTTEIDPITEKQFGWLPLGPFDYFHKEALETLKSGIAKIKEGTYELCGPKINGNKEGFLSHVLVKHGECIYHDAPRTFNKLREYFKDKDIEGLVFYHRDGRRAKIRKVDFMLKRKP